MSASNEPPELSELEQARWAAARSLISGLALSSADRNVDTEAVEATVAQLRQIDVDLARVRDAIHLPEDAVDYAGALTAVLRRIPDGWGRWIDCEAGWYGLVAELDAALSQLDADYSVLQVKEKFGTLRYYFATETTDDDMRVRFDELVRCANEQSAVTCERCGGRGVLNRTAGGWLKTLCGRCADRIAELGGSRYRSIQPED